MIKTGVSFLGTGIGALAWDFFRWLEQWQCWDPGVFGGRDDCDSSNDLQDA